MTNADSLTRTETSIDTTAPNGAPSNAELGERIAGVEATVEGHDEKLDDIRALLSGRLDDLEQSHDEMEDQHNRLWWVFQTLKKAAAGGLGGGVLLDLLGVL
ncbi:hypothetical protein [Haladaptatus cibarius]|uniref:hypothetical protein n=1 Tax=Haladaptatus cibarius TaxID=453847 RepID=UPI0006795695|nr:hypothetical protein [Haladaptatus cibarius]